MPEHATLLEMRAELAVWHARRLHSETQLAVMSVIDQGPGAPTPSALLALWMTLVDCLREELGTTKQYMLDASAAQDNARAQLVQQPWNAHLRATYNSLTQHYEELAQKHGYAVAVYRQLLHELRAPRDALDT